MPTDHAIGDGDCTISVAADAMFYDWKPIWDADENEALRQSRKSPFVLLRDWRNASFSSASQMGFQS